MFLSENDRLKNRTENTLEDITQSDKSDNYSHIIDEEGSCKTHERAEDSYQNQLFVGEIFEPEKSKKYSLIDYHNQPKKSQYVSTKFSRHTKFLMQE